MEPNQGQGGSRGVKRSRSEDDDNDEEAKEAPPQPAPPQPQPQQPQRNPAAVGAPVQQLQQQNDLFRLALGLNLPAQQPAPTQQQQQQLHLQQQLSMLLGGNPGQGPAPPNLQAPNLNLQQGAAAAAVAAGGVNANTDLMIRLLAQGGGGNLLQALQPTGQNQPQQQPLQLPPGAQQQQPQPPHGGTGLPSAVLLQALSLQGQFATRPPMPAAAAAASNPTQLSPAVAALAAAAATGGAPLSLPVGHSDAVAAATVRQSQGGASVAAAAAAANPAPARVDSHGITGRPPLVMYNPMDEGRLTPYQCLARKHLEYFEADQAKVEEGAQGRNKAIVLGQVGIRCRFCCHLKRKEKAPAAAFYPSKLSGIYQSAQNIINSHLAKDCTKVPQEIREELLRLGNRKSAPGGGKAYWAEEASQVGVYEDGNGLRFAPEAASVKPAAVAGGSAPASAHSKGLDP